jgi:sulfide:quinone oxidoreductase
MTVKMAKTAALAIVSDITGKSAPAETPIDVICLMDMGNTAAYMKAAPVLPPRQDSVFKEGKWFRWSKVVYERYFLWKMKNGFSGLP